MSTERVTAQRPATPMADKTADHFHLPRWRTKNDFLSWLHRDGHRKIHPLLAMAIHNELSNAGLAEEG